jgi:hypothetical protein
LVDDIYNKYFASYFRKEAEMHTRFQDTDLVISDKELEWIITSLPLDLFSVSNALSQFKQHNEIVKLKIKQRKNKGAEEADSELDDEYKLMSIIYTSVITRVEQEISFSKELIMGAKKIWDARRSGEHAPIGEVVPKELPEYRLDTGVNERIDF